MCGIDLHAEVTKKKLKDGEFVRLDHARRDMNHILMSLGYHVEATGDDLETDERAMLRQIADDYGLDWPEGL